MVVLARPVTGAKLLPEWTGPLAQGHMVVVSRLTQQLATDRNALVAQLAERIVVAHASPTGSLATQVERWRHEGRQVDMLAAG